MHKCIHKRCADILNKLAIIGFISVSLVALISFESRRAGPAEQAGKEIGKVAVSVEKQVEKAGENIQDEGKPESP